MAERERDGGSQRVRDKKRQRHREWQRERDGGRQRLRDKKRQRHREWQ